MNKNRSREQIEVLANFIMSHCPFEIENEAPIAVAIRVMGRMARGIEHALFELNIPDGSQADRAAWTEGVLRGALGQWGKGLSENFPNAEGGMVCDRESPHP